MDNQVSDTTNHEVRSLKWRLKIIAKQCGRQGETIYALRNENAALREAVKWNPGDRARLFAEVRTLSVENRRLKEKLDAQAEAGLSSPSNDLRVDFA